MESIKNIWNNFVDKHPTASKWVREGGLFFIFSNFVTIIQYIIYAFLPNLLGLEMAGIDWSWPAIPANLFGIDFTWNALGYDVVFYCLGGDYFCRKLYQLRMGSCGRTFCSNMVVQHRIHNDYGNDFHGSIFLCV